MKETISMNYSLWHFSQTFEELIIKSFFIGNSINTFLTFRQHYSIHKDGFGCSAFLNRKCGIFLQTTLIIAFNDPF